MTNQGMLGIIGHSFRLSMCHTSRPRRPSGLYTERQGTGRLVGRYHRPRFGHFAQAPDCGRASCRMNFTPSGTGRCGTPKGLDSGPLAEAPGASSGVPVGRPLGMPSGDRCRPGGRCRRARLGRSRPGFVSRYRMSQTASSARLRSAMPESTKALSTSKRSREARFEVFRLAGGSASLLTAHPRCRREPGGHRPRGLGAPPGACRCRPASSVGRARPA